MTSSTNQSQKLTSFKSLVLLSINTRSNVNTSSGITIEFYFLHPLKKGA